MAETLAFDSGGTRCVATFYRPRGDSESVPCVVMGHGFCGTQDQLAGAAETFAAAGLAALTFDYRHFGQSAGEPRQVIDVRKQLEDWRAAVNLARSLDVVDRQRIALWGTSLSGGHVINLAAGDPSVAAVVAQVLAIDKSTRQLVKEAKAKMAREGISLAALVRVSLRSVAAGAYDALRGRAGLAPRYMRVIGRPGQVAAFTSPDGDKWLQLFERTGPTWRNEFAPRFLFNTPRYENGTAERVQMPLLICVAERDTDANPELAMEIARRAPRGDLRTYPVEHFEVYAEPTAEILLQDQVEFLRKVLLTSTPER